MMYLVLAWDSDDDCQLVFEGSKEQCAKFIEANADEFHDDGCYLTLAYNRNWELA